MKITQALTAKKLSEEVTIFTITYMLISDDGTVEYCQFPLNSEDLRELYLVIENSYRLFSEQDLISVLDEKLQETEKVDNPLYGKHNQE